MLELIGLTKRYGDVLALDGLGMTVAPGRMHGFVGRNGAGKTTAMRVALGLVEPDAGEVRWRGDTPSEDDRARFGYMPEERGLYPKMGIVDQVAYFGQLSGMVAGAAREQAAKWLTELGLDDRMTDAAETLSQGNQQRVQLAVALVQDPDLLVLDEPFNGLDPVGAAGAAVVFSSHQLDLVERLCHEVTIVDAGRVVAAGPIGELRARHATPVLRVEVEGAGTGWARAVTGVASVREAGGALLVELADGADDQAVLDAARAAGRVVTFAREVPSLADTFREVVPR